MGILDFVIEEDDFVPPPVKHPHDVHIRIFSFSNLSKLDNLARLHTCIKDYHDWDPPDKTYVCFSGGLGGDGLLFKLDEGKSVVDVLANPPEGLNPSEPELDNGPFVKHGQTNFPNNGNGTQNRSQSGAVNGENGAGSKKCTPNGTPRMEGVTSSPVIPTLVLPVPTVYAPTVLTPSEAPPSELSVPFSPTDVGTQVDPSGDPHGDQQLETINENGQKPPCHPFRVDIMSLGATDIGLGQKALETTVQLFNEKVAQFTGSVWLNSNMTAGDGTFRSSVLNTMQKYHVDSIPLKEETKSKAGILADPEHVFRIGFLGLCTPDAYKVAANADIEMDYSQVEPIFQLLPEENASPTDVVSTKPSKVDGLATQQSRATLDDDDSTLKSDVIEQAYEKHHMRTISDGNLHIRPVKIAANEIIGQSMHKHQSLDAIICLTHQSQADDERLMKQEPDIDIVLGGYDDQPYHQFLDDNGEAVHEDPKTGDQKITSRLIAKAGKNLEKVAIIDIIIGRDDVDDEESAVEGSAPPSENYSRPSSPMNFPTSPVAGSGFGSPQSTFNLEMLGAAAASTQAVERTPSKIMSEINRFPVVRNRSPKRPTRRGKRLKIRSHRLVDLEPPREIVSRFVEKSTTSKQPQSYEPNRLILEQIVRHRRILNLDNFHLFDWSDYDPYMDFYIARLEQYLSERVVWANRNRFGGASKSLSSAMVGSKSKQLLDVSKSLATMRMQATKAFAADLKTQQIDHNEEGRWSSEAAFSKQISFHSLVAKWLKEAFVLPSQYDETVVLLCARSYRKQVDYTSLKTTFSYRDLANELRNRDEFEDTRVIKVRIKGAELATLIYESEIEKKGSHWYLQYDKSSINVIDATSTIIIDEDARADMPTMKAGDGLGQGTTGPGFCEVQAPVKVREALLLKQTLNRSQIANPQSGYTSKMNQSSNRPTSGGSKTNLSVVAEEDGEGSQSLGSQALMSSDIGGLIVSQAMAGSVGHSVHSLRTTGDSVRLEAESTSLQGLPPVLESNQVFENESFEDAMEASAHEFSDNEVSHAILESVEQYDETVQCVVVRVGGGSTDEELMNSRDEIFTPAMPPGTMEAQIEAVEFQEESPPMQHATTMHLDSSISLNTESRSVRRNGAESGSGGENANENSDEEGEGEEGEDGEGTGETTAAAAAPKVIDYAAWMEESSEEEVDVTERRVIQPPNEFQILSINGRPFDPEHFYIAIVPANLLRTDFNLPNKFPMILEPHQLNDDDEAATPKLHYKDDAYQTIESFGVFSMEVAKVSPEEGEKENDEGEDAESAEGGETTEGGATAGKAADKRNSKDAKNKEPPKEEPEERLIGKEAIPIRDQHYNSLKDIGDHIGPNLQSVIENCPSLMTIIPHILMKDAWNALEPFWNATKSFTLGDLERIVKKRSFKGMSPQQRVQLRIELEQAGELAPPPPEDPDQVLEDQTLIWKMFNILDLNGDGVIDETEIAHIVKTCGMKAAFDSRHFTKAAEHRQQMNKALSKFRVKAIENRLAQLEAEATRRPSRQSSKMSRQSSKVSVTRSPTRSKESPAQRPGTAEEQPVDPSTTLLDGVLPTTMPLDGAEATMLEGGPSMLDPAMAFEDPSLQQEKDLMETLGADTAAETGKEQTSSAEEQDSFGVLAELRKRQQQRRSMGADSDSDLNPICLVPQDGVIYTTGNDDTQTQYYTPIDDVRHQLREIGAKSDMSDVDC